MIICKDDNGICNKSSKNICCIDCEKFIECKEKDCYCRSLRYNNTKKLISENCIFANNIENKKE